MYVFHLIFCPFLYRARHLMRVADEIEKWSKRALGIFRGHFGVGISGKIHELANGIRLRKCENVRSQRKVYFCNKKNIPKKNWANFFSGALVPIAESNKYIRRQAEATVAAAAIVLLTYLAHSFQASPNQAHLGANPPSFSLYLNRLLHCSVFHAYLSGSSSSADK